MSKNLNNTKYFLTNTFNPEDGIIIDKNQFDLFKNSMLNILEASFIEDKFNILIDNYYEFESELLSVALSNLVYHSLDYSSMHEKRILVGRRLVNLLTASRMFIDQTSIHISCIYGKNSTQLSKINHKRKSLHKNHISYRIMEALRNYAQHCNFPFHIITFSSETLDLDTENNQVYSTVVPSLDREELKKDSRFKPSIIEEMKSFDSHIDLRPITREYIYCLTQLITTIRDIVSSDFKTWKNNINLAFELFQAKDGNIASALKLGIKISADTDPEIDAQTIFTDAIKRREELIRKNSNYKAFHKHFITNTSIITKNRLHQYMDLSNWIVSSTELQTDGQVSEKEIREIAVSELPGYPKIDFSKVCTIYWIGNDLMWIRDMMFRFDKPETIKTGIIKVMKYISNLGFPDNSFAIQELQYALERIEAIIGFSDIGGKEAKKIFQEYTVVHHHIRRVKFLMQAILLENEPGFVKL